MIFTRKDIIIATEKIIDLSGDERRKLLLTLLETNPTCVLRALSMEDVTAYAKPGHLFKVAITDLNGENRKINTIKTFREMTGNGLADSKAWAEGQAVGYNIDMLIPSGVFGHHLSADMAKDLIKKVKTSLGDLKMKVEIVPDNAYVKPLPNSWA